MNKPTVSLPIIVEGKYDKIKLDSLFNAHVITTEGFSLFKAKEKAALLRRLAEKNGVIVLTDSDGGGRQIRSFLSGILPKDKVYHLFIPAVLGKEKRKKTPSRAGTLGVEGTENETLLTLLSPFTSQDKPPLRGSIDKCRLYLDGLSGAPSASEKRKRLCLFLGFPEDMTANALLDAINLLYTEEEYDAILKNVFL